MRAATGEYIDWRFIKYEPIIADLLPHSLLPYLSAGQSTLDIGCNIGNVALFLARREVNVTGIDINSNAINRALEKRDQEGLASTTSFVLGDVLEELNIGPYDAILMTRILTCFPSVLTWRRLLSRAYSLVKEGGLLYVHDFMLAEESEVYKARYDAASKVGCRYGNFDVKDRSGNLMFIAHHHSEEELAEIISPYEKQHLEFHKSISMNGNECIMFEFIGRKVSIR
jgi:ubiquinone/menaquinone biosynthesis C-methylase UbiE